MDTDGGGIDEWFSELMLIKKDDVVVLLEIWWQVIGGKRND
jgi:hypothetical protein